MDESIVEDPYRSPCSTANSASDNQAKQNQTSLGVAILVTFSGTLLAIVSSFYLLACAGAAIMTSIPKGDLAYVLGGTIIAGTISLTATVGVLACRRLWRWQR